MTNAQKAIDMFPEIVIPKDCRPDFNAGTLSFTHETPLGNIEVEASSHWREFMYCRGTPEVITGFGLCKPEWLPGEPGNGATCQTVVFEDDGPRLLRGKGGKRSKAPSITIRAWGAGRRTVEVRLQMTPEQAKQFAALKDQLWHDEEIRRENSKISLFPKGTPKMDSIVEELVETISKLNDDGRQRMLVGVRMMAASLSNESIKEKCRVISLADRRR